MAKGYPGKKRARKAFWQGVKSARRLKAFNPYRQPRLKELFDRGRVEAQLKPALLERVPVKGNRPQRHFDQRQERSSQNLRRARAGGSVPFRNELRRDRF